MRQKGIPKKREIRQGEGKSEDGLSLLFPGAVAVMLKKRDRFDPKVLKLLLAAILLSVASEMAFTS